MPPPRFLNQKSFSNRIFYLSFLLVFLFSCGNPSKNLKCGCAKGNCHEPPPRRREGMINKANYQLNIRKGARILGGSADMKSAKVKIIKLSGGKTRTELFIDVAICLDNNLELIPFPKDGFEVVYTTS